MDKRYRYLKKNKEKIFGILVLFIVIYLVIPFASAKYQYSYQARSRTVTSDSFYFSVDLAEDSKMTEVASEEGKTGEEMQNLNSSDKYQFDEKEEKIWHLYGGARHTISIQLRNYYDALRITQAEIGYRATVFVQDVDGKEMNPSFASIRMANQEETTQTSQGGNTSIEGTLTGERIADSAAYGMQEKELILDIEQYNNENYKDGTTVKLVIESTTPYKKTIELNFILHHADDSFSYEIRDFSGSAYAELIMRNNLSSYESAQNQENERDFVQPYLVWSEELSIDNTNTLTYHMLTAQSDVDSVGESDSSNINFVQQEIQTLDNQGSMRRMQISRPLKKNESCSIYFFKSDIGQDYTKEITKVSPSADGNFEIWIQAKNSGNESLNVNNLQIKEESLETGLPYQEVSISSERQYLGINGNDSQNGVAITNRSSFTLQFTTQYTPGNYENMRETLQTSFHELYLWDGESTVVTAIESDFAGSSNIELQSIVKGNSPQSTEGCKIEQRVAGDGSIAYYLISPKSEEEVKSSTESMGEAEPSTESIGEAEPSTEPIGGVESSTEPIGGVESSIESMGESEANTIIKSTESREIDGGLDASDIRSDASTEVQEKALSLISTASSGFSIPRGTVITMIAKIDNNQPTYWYYYCMEEKTEISLSDFRQMNTVDTGNVYNLSAASKNQVNADTNEMVAEKLCFTFDFENAVSKMTGTQREACARLKHVATVDGIDNVEIMNYVEQGVKQNNLDSTGNAELSALRCSYLKTSDIWKISENTEDDRIFNIRMTDMSREYSVRDTYEFQVEIGEKEIGENLEYEDTRCDGREYAVKLELIEMDENGNPSMDSDGNIRTRAFPEGMIMLYNDQQISTTENNQVFILPVKSAGIHTFKLSTGLSAFCDGNSGMVMLRASLYASKDASYYNDISLNKNSSISFAVKEEPEYALKVGDYRMAGEENKKQLLERGEKFSLGVYALKDGASESEDTVSIAIYQFDKVGQNYTRVDWSQVFTNEENTTVRLSSDFVTWTGSISENAMSGVYRLEFVYHDKTEYEDFIIK